MEILTRVTEAAGVTPPRPPGTDAPDSIIRSHLLMRTVVGALGIAMPILLVCGDLVFLDGSVSARGSLSAYYHSGMRDVFVGILVIVGIALVTYKLFEARPDNWVSIAAGLGALGVALFPTRRPTDISIALTPLQDHWGENVVARIHYGSAALFIVCLLVLTVFFGVREGSRPRDGRGARRSPRFWQRWHFFFASVIAIGIGIIVVTKGFGIADKHSLLIGEWVAVWGFGASWLMKGLELDLLWGRSTRTS